MSKEIEEMRAHKARMKRVEKDIEDELRALSKRLQDKGYMFMCVIGDGKGMVLETACWGPSAGYPRLLSTMANSACQILLLEASSYKKRLQENGIDTDFSEGENHDT